LGGTGAGVPLAARADELPGVLGSSFGTERHKGGVSPGPGWGGGGVTLPPAPRGTEGGTPSGGGPRGIGLGAGQGIHKKTSRDLTGGAPRDVSGVGPPGHHTGPSSSRPPVWGGQQARKNKLMWPSSFFRGGPAPPAEAGRTRGGFFCGPEPVGVRGAGGRRPGGRRGPKKPRIHRRVARPPRGGPGGPQVRFQGGPGAGVGAVPHGEAWRGRETTVKQGGLSERASRGGTARAWTFFGVQEIRPAGTDRRKPPGGGAARRADWGGGGAARAVQGGNLGAREAAGAARGRGGEPEGGPHPQTAWLRPTIGFFFRRLAAEDGGAGGGARGGPSQGGAGGRIAGQGGGGRAPPVVVPGGGGRGKGGGPVCARTLGGRGGALKGGGPGRKAGSPGGGAGGTGKPATPVGADFHLFKNTAC